MQFIKDSRQWALDIKKAFIFTEADAEKRKTFNDQIACIERSKIVYIDESGIDKCDQKERGWGLKSKKLYEKKSGKYYARMNIIAGLNCKKPIAPMVFSGFCNTAVFNQWVEECLIKELRAGQVVVMDNASFHKSKKTIELIESVGCKVLFLPPYSPDLNPIEKFWANMKRFIKNIYDSTISFFDKIKRFFQLPTSC